MILWPILVLMTLAAVFAVWWPLSRREWTETSGSDIAVYRDQLEEIDRDEAGGLIGSAEAEAARVEVSRRLIAAADSAKAANASALPVPVFRYRLATLVAAILLLPLGAGFTYHLLGSPDLVPVSIDAAAGSQALPTGIENTVAEVETYLESNPKNGRGWELLAPVYLRLGRFDDAVRARRNALEIFGPDAARLGDLGEAIVVASSGVVTPEAKSLFERANAADPEDVMAQYYLGLSAKQEGRREEAVRRWTALVSSASEGAEWLPMVKNALARVDEKSPPVMVAAPAAAVSPPEHSGSAIEAMVERLAQRLKQDGSDVPGWVQLVRSYRVLGQSEKVKAATADAHAALAGNAEALQRLDQGLAGLDTNVVLGISGPGAAGMAPTAANVASKGPIASDIAASGTPSEVDGGAIAAMVERLAQRLKKDGSDVPGWVQLVRSYRVLGKADQVNLAIANAHAALSGDPEALQRLDQGLQALGAEVIPDVSGPGAAGSPPASANAAPKEPIASDIAASSAPRAIEAMVERLAQRLKQDGSDVPGWVQLVRSYRVLGQSDKVKTATADAHAALAGNAEALQRLDQGLTGLDTEAGSVASAPVAAGSVPASAGVAMPGPDASQVAAAEQMAPAERNGMIDSMVARLAQRMAANGSDVDGWLRLIKAYTVLGQRDKALGAAASARGALAGNDDNLRRIGELTKELGLEGS